MKEGENVLRILKETREAVNRSDSAKIKALSNQTINTASLTQDSDNIAVAVIVYSLSKIVERPDYKKYSGWSEFYKQVLKAIDRAIAAMEKNDEQGLRENIKLIRQAINKLSGKLKFYIKDVFRKARINKASRIYEHGISMERTASLLGITMFELSEYAGQTGISDVPLGKTLGVKKRIETAMEMFE